MFTGIVETKGKIIEHVRGQNAHRLVIKAPMIQLSCGESLAVNGVCLTLLEHPEGLLAFDISPETLRLTTLNHLYVGDEVNLERAMVANARFGGHYVSGHVDTTAHVLSLKTVDQYLDIRVGQFAMPAQRFLLPKGSIALNGVSLTINEVESGAISLMLVPHTLAVTTFAQLKVGQVLNVEFDYLTRVIAHQLQQMNLMGNVDIA
jgi:riboflavin synthase